jgi:hypothetical protein
VPGSNEPFAHWARLLSEMIATPGMHRATVRAELNRFYEDRRRSGGGEYPYRDGCGCGICRAESWVRESERGEEMPDGERRRLGVARPPIPPMTIDWTALGSVARPAPLAQPTEGGFSFTVPRTTERLVRIEGWQRPVEANWQLYLINRPFWMYVRGSGSGDEVAQEFELSPIGTRMHLRTAVVRSPIRREEVFPFGSGVRDEGGREVYLEGVDVVRIGSEEIGELQTVYLARLTRGYAELPEEFRFRVKEEKEVGKKKKKPTKWDFGGIWGQTDQLTPTSVYLFPERRGDGGIHFYFVDSNGRAVANGALMSLVIDGADGSLALDIMEGVSSALPVALDGCGRIRMHGI